MAKTASRLGKYLHGPSPGILKLAAAIWLKIARYVVDGFEAADDKEAAAIRAVTGGVGAPILLPSARAISELHRAVRSEQDSDASASEQPRTPDTPLQGLDPLDSANYETGILRDVRSNIDRNKRGKRKAVLVLSTDSKTVGGIQRYAQTWAQVLYEAGYAPRTIALWPNGVREKPLSSLRISRFALSSILTAIVRRPIAVICTHVGLSPVARIIKKLFGTAYAVSLHGDDSWRCSKKPRVVQALKDADLVLSVSHFTRDVVCEQTHIPKAKTYVTGSILSPDIELQSALANPAAYTTALEMLYRGDSPPLTDTSPKTSKDSNGRPSHDFDRSLCQDRKPLILTVARLDANAPYKRHDLVIKAMPKLLSRFPGLRYFVVGDGSYRRRLEELTNELGVAEYVEFIGRVSEKRLAELYSNASCFVMPSRISLDPPEGEGFGLVYLEAGVWGLPSVAARGGGSTETVLDEQTGLLADPDSLESLVEKIERVLSDRVLRDRLGERARIRALEFSYPRFSRRCRAAIMAIIDDPKRRGSGLAKDTDPSSVASSYEPEYPRDRLFDVRYHNREPEKEATLASSYLKDEEIFRGSAIT